MEQLAHTGGEGLLQATAAAEMRPEALLGRGRRGGRQAGGEGREEDVGRLLQHLGPGRLFLWWGKVGIRPGSQGRGASLGNNIEGRRGLIPHLGLLKPATPLNPLNTDIC